MDKRTGSGSGLDTRQLKVVLASWVGRRVVCSELARSVEVQMV